MKVSANTQYELCVGGVGLSLQCSYQDIDKTQPQWQERHRLVVRAAIFFVELPLQQNLKDTVGVVNNLGHLKTLQQEKGSGFAPWLPAHQQALRSSKCIKERTTNANMSV